MKTLRNWKVVNPENIRIQADHPEKPGKVILTSPIRKVFGNQVTTESGTRYLLEKPVDESEWDKFPADQV